MAVRALPNLREQVTAKLREQIGLGALKPGDRLIERELCEVMGISRTSIREAFRELEAEGLLTSIGNRGLVVSPVSPEFARSLYKVRAALESLAVQLFTLEASDPQVRELEKATRLLRKVYQKFEPRKFLKAKSDFYDIILNGAGNEVLSSTLRSIHLRVSQLRVTSLSEPGRTIESIVEIEKFVEAISRRDTEAACTLCREHVENASRVALHVLEQEKGNTPNTQVRSVKSGRV